MVLKILFMFLLLTVIIFMGHAQKLKVMRKGAPPINVTKKVSADKSNYTIEQFTGKWQEVSRRGKKNSSLDFKDTLFYNFSGNGQVLSRDGVNMSMSGQAAIEPGNVLVAAADVFTIRSMTKNQVILDDGEYIHTLVRKKDFWHEGLPTNAVTSEEFITPILIDASALLGKWKVYRREAKPGLEHKALIKMLDIKSNKNTTEAVGEITFYNSEKSETLPGTLILEGKKMIISTQKNSWNVSVFKADGKELVFGDDILIYYCKLLY